jgi:hypothetical protein
MDTTEIHSYLEKYQLIHTELINGVYKNMPIRFYQELEELIDNMISSNYTGNVLVNPPINKQEKLYNKYTKQLIKQYNLYELDKKITINDNTCKLWKLFLYYAICK